MDEKIKQLEAELAELKKQKRQVIIPIENPDFGRLIRLCKDYVEFTGSADYHEENDYAQCFFETALETVYGGDIFERLS